jgi:hypothetical protein
VHGVIFTSLRDYVTSEHSPETAKQLFEGEPIFLLSEAYADERLAQLIARAAELTSLGEEELLHDFGVFTAETTFTRLYPAFFAISRSTRDFLLTVETRIHELVRATMPNARPPQLMVTELGTDGVLIEYSSPRRLCVLLRGLAEGTARHYGEAASFEETSCMRRSDPICSFEIRFNPASPSA